LQIEATQHDEKEDVKDSVGCSSPISNIFRSPLATTPPPEPVLVPTEYYAPSKLDATMASTSQTQLGHTYWSLNTISPRKPEPEHHTELATKYGFGASIRVLLVCRLKSEFMTTHKTKPRGRLVRLRLPCEEPFKQLVSIRNFEGYEHSSTDFMTQEPDRASENGQTYSYATQVLESSLHIYCTNISNTYKLI
jgi:hypothetical protein